jgi:hypothetical protein
MSDAKFYIVSVLIGAISFFGVLTYHESNILKSKEKALELAISKGIDPIAVKCFYETSVSTLCTQYISKTK